MSTLEYLCSMDVNNVHYEKRAGLSIVRVPGGWIYDLGERTGRAAVVFVPEPAGASVKKERSKSKQITMKTFLDNCKERKEPAIPKDHAAVKYADSIGLPKYFLSIHFNEFVERYVDTQKKYVHWRRTFTNSVRANWFHIWTYDASGAYVLTSKGKQAEIKWKAQRDG